MKRKLIFLLCALLTSVGMWAQETPVNDGVYYIYNEANDLFLTRGQSWGTQAVAKPVGLPWKVSITDGKYTLRMYDLTVAGSTSGFGSNAYTDNGSPITFTPSGNASGGFTLQNGDSYITCPNSAGAVSLSATSSSWKFLTQAQYDAALAARVAAQESAIATLKGISIPDGQSLNDVVTDGDNWRTSATVNDGVPTSSKWSANKDGARGGNTNWGDYGTEMYQCGNAHYTRTITGLTKGIYKVTVRGMKRVGWNEGCSTMGDAGYPVSDAYLSANGYIIRMKAWYEDRTDASNPNSTGSFVTIVNNGGYTTEGFVYVGDDGELVLDAGSEAYWGGSWFLFNGISYTYYDNSVSDDDVNALIATIPAHVSDAHVSAMESAKTTLQGSKTIANYNALVAAIEAAQTSANEYAIIDAGTVPTNNIAGWAKSTTNGTLACNTWSTEGNTDGSGMTTPFIQDWVGSGTPLAGGNAGGKLYYSFTDLNPGETYVVTARVRVFNEASTGVTGATYFVGSSTKPLDATFSSPCVGDFAAKGRFAVLSCAGTVDSNGDLQFGIELADDSPINWISIKDVTIAAGTGDVPTAIEMNKTAVTLTTGGSETLTATITPATADDKTTLWTSSDETVATVSGGTVVALKAGTATITATAYAGTSVEATCTVTVTDAAAPSYYSTTIAAGDYYIYNAATGMFLGGGNSWGTQASLIEHGIPFTVGVGEGVYTLDSHTYNNETDHFFNGTYVDGASTNLYITSLGSGKFAISTAASSAYAAALPGSTVVANSAASSDSPLAQWYFLSKNDRDKTLAAATALNPVDATYYIKQANISRNLSAGAYNVNAWSQYSVDGTQDNTNHAAQVYNATVDNKQVIENIPNGTYKVTVQAFTSGTDVKFYANNEKVDVKNNDSGAASCSAAAALFAQDLYPNTVTVTVTDRTLTLGFEGDCSGAKWLCYDKFEMEMTSYTANTGVSASIDKSEIQIGQTANITAATVPATASFNAITRYVSSNEEVATVDENGVVTGVAVGDATITVYAEEMESFSNTVDVSVTLVVPTAITLSETSVDLDKDNTTVTLTVASTTPDGANDAVTWTSSDESVATVAGGVVTAVSSGTATITATSVVAPTVTATATINVTFPEMAEATHEVINEAAMEKTVYTLGDNIIKNGSFEYPDAYYGWTVGNGNKMTSAQFTVEEDGGNKYIQSVLHNGSNSAGALRQAWPIEAGKKYLFGYKLKNVSGTQVNNNEWFRVSLCNANPTAGDGTVITQYPSYNGAWTDYAVVVDNTESSYTFVQAHFRWLGDGSEHTAFDDFFLAEITNTEVIDLKATASDYAALNAAMSGKTIGFEDGEYAPYNNVAAAAALAAAQAINQSENNLASVVQDATTALTSATWTANVGEQNAFYDGTFAAAENNGAPAGWTMSNNTLGGSYHSRAFNPNNHLSEFNATNSGLFLRFDGTNSSRGSMYYYGNTAGYTMPLKANTDYFVKVDFAGWGSTGKPLRINVTGPAGFEAVNQQFNTSNNADAADNTPQQFLIFFHTTDAGNYVVNFQTPGSDSNTHNVVISNCELYKATLINETATYAAVAGDTKMVQLTRTIKAEDKWNTIVLPFDVNNTDLKAAFGNDVQIAEFSEIADGTSSTITFATMATPAIEANKPVLLKTSTAGTVYTFRDRSIEDGEAKATGNGNFNFIGTYAASFTVPANDYFISSNTLYKSKGTTTLKGTRAYLENLGATEVKMFIDDLPTSINGLMADDEENGPVYNLAGQRVQKAQKGIFVKNGRKVVVK